MQDSVKAILGIFNRAGFEAYYNGEKCRNELYNAVVQNKHLKTLNTTIITNALPEEIKRIFPRAIENENNKMIFSMEFGNEVIGIESFHKQTYYLKNGNKETFLTIPQIEHVNTLKEDYQRKIFTINCVAQDINDEYHYEDISAYNDMEKGIIRTIDNPKDVFFEFPIRTLQAFTLMSQTGFLIEKNTLKSIHSTMRYLRNMPSELVGKELRKIMTGRYVMQTLKLMHKEGIFNAKCLDEDKKIKIMSPFHECDDTKFDVLKRFRISNEVELELWSVLFEDKKQAYEELNKFHCFSEKEIHTILWLMDNKNLCKKSDNDIGMRKDIYNSIGEYEQQFGIHYLKELIIKSNHIYKMTDVFDTKEKKDKYTKRLMFNLCCRPYFVNQLTWDITDENKEKLIPKLLNTVHYPITDNEVAEFMKQNLGG